jgi:hypothetical protein
MSGGRGRWQGMQKKPLIEFAYLSLKYERGCKYINSNIFFIIWLIYGIWGYDSESIGLGEGGWRKLIIQELHDLYSSPILLGRWDGWVMWLAWDGTKMRTPFWQGILKGYNFLRISYKWENIIKMSRKEIRWRLWTIFILYRIGNNGWLLWTRWWTLWLHKTRVMCWLVHDVFPYRQGVRNVWRWNLEWIIFKQSPYRAVNTLHLCYRNQSVNAV